MLAKRTYKNQITIPKEIIKGFGSVTYFDVKRRGDEIILQPVTITPQTDKLQKIRTKIEALGITEKDIEEATRSARKTN